MIDKRKTLAVVFLIMFILPTVCGINLGSIQKTKEMEVNKGQTAEFLLMFWNNENQELNLFIQAENIPDDWVVVSKPRELSLKKSEIKIAKTIMAIKTPFFIKRRKNL